MDNVNHTHFIPVAPGTGLLLDQSGEEHPHKFWAWDEDAPVEFSASEGTAYGYVQRGESAVLFNSGPLAGRAVHVYEGMHFCVPWAFTVSGGNGFVVTRSGFKGVFSTGGPVERLGRMRYIDGCTDSLLIPPVLKGDSCLNHLHFPSGISQTRHTHPSNRVGIVTKGRGRCVIPANDDGTGPDVDIPLTPGMLFVIPTEGQHSFFTDDSTMDVIAFHPDSDFGPEHENHPMINRTIVGGVSAAALADIRSAVDTPLAGE